MSATTAEQPVLDAADQRVLGSLLEKERTVPDAYPLTLNALRSACNQTSGRDPVLSLEDHEVTASIDRLKALGLARVVHAGAGARATRYRQVADERLGLDDAERAVVTLLLLRGPQTPGELRSRSDRLHPFASLDEVAGALGRLLDREPALVRELERQPGQKERRWTHLLGPTAAAVPTPTDGSRATPPSAGPGSGPRTEDDPTAQVLAGGAEARDARVVATYDAVAAAYAERGLDAVDEKPFDRWLLERLAVEAGSDPIADVGCGPGSTTAFVAMAAAGPVTGYDLSSGVVVEARRRFPEVAFEVADLRSLPAPTEGDDGWGLVLSWYSLVHLAAAELPAAVAALAGSLRPGGRLAVAVHVGSGVVHHDEWCGAPVDVDFVLHEPGSVLAAVRSAGLVEVEWYRRGPLAVEAETERLYVVARRP